MRSLARDAGVAPGYLSMVLSGERRISPMAWKKVSQFLGLTQTERNYFQWIQALGESETQKDKLRALEKIQRFRAFRKLNPKEFEVYRYLTHWYYVAIREMASLPKFQPDPAWIAPKLREKVNKIDIQSALDFLFQNGFLERTQDGHIRQVNKQVDCMGGVFGTVLGQFQKEMLKLASSSIDNVPSGQRDIIGHTLAIPSDCFSKVRDILHDALGRIADLGKNIHGTGVVYHVSLATFPLTSEILPGGDK